MKNKLTGKDRIRLALEHETTDRIPIGMLCGGINQPALKNFDHFLKKQEGIDAAAYINSFLDIVEIWSFDIGPKMKNGYDVMGVQRKDVSFGEGSYSEIAHFPLMGAQTLEEIKNHPWPDTSMFDYSMVPALINERNPDPSKATILGVANPFETAWSIRGFEQIFLDMMLQPEMAHELMKRVNDFFIEHFVKFIKASKGKIGYAFTADDVAGQDGLLLQPELYREFIKPYHTKLNAALHEAGVKIFYHSCGSVTNLVNEIKETGIDALQSLQFNAENMDPKFLKENYGKDISFEGGMCVQKVLPFGKQEDVIEMAETLIDELGKNGGYVFGPSHYVQAGTPPENIYAMFEKAQNYYPF